MDLQAQASLSTRSTWADRYGRRWRSKSMSNPSDHLDDMPLGTPIDLRTDGQRDRAFRSAWGDFELAAARVVARYLGERVLLVDDNTANAQVDVRIDYADGHTGWAEVITDTDEEYARLYEKVRGEGFKLESTLPSRHWQLHLAPSCDFRWLRNEGIASLTRLEAEGLYFPNYTEHGALLSAGSATAAELANHGVIALCSRAAQHGDTGAVQIFPQGIGGPQEEDWDGFHLELSGLLRNSKVAEHSAKLMATEAEERHLFVGTTWTSAWPLDYWLHEEHDELPDRPPHLPPEITHLWLWSVISSRRVLGWFPDRGWFDPSRNWATE
jgi:hypothetical protein